MTTVIMAVLQAGVAINFINFSSSPILTPADKETAAAASGDEHAVADGLATPESMGAGSNEDGNATAAEVPIHSSSSTHRHPQHTPTCQVKSERPPSPC